MRTVNKYIIILIISTTNHDFLSQVTQVEVPAYEPLQYHPEYVTIYPKLDDYKPIAHHKLSSPYVLTDKLHIYSTDSRHKLLRIAANHHQPQEQHSHAGVYPYKYQYKIPNMFLIIRKKLLTFFW